MPSISRKSAKPTMITGMDLPAMISNDEKGMTSNCSSVPSSRSREKASAANSNTVNSSIKPNSAGVVYSASDRFSLNHTRRLGSNPFELFGVQPQALDHDALVDARARPATARRAAVPACSLRRSG